jgi:hypothetical protein
VIRKWQLQVIAVAFSFIQFKSKKAKARLFSIVLTGTNAVFINNLLKL